MAAFILLATIVTPAVTSAVAVYLFMLGFLREGSAVAIIWIPLAIVFAVVLSRLRVRDRGDMREASS